MRIRCSACGTEQDREGDDAPCSICGVSPDAAPTAAGPRGSGDPEIFDVEASDEGGAAPRLPGRAPDSRPVEVDEILAAHKRMTSLLALVPVWGIWRIWRSDLHGVSEKLLLSVISVLLATALGVGVRVLLPDEADRIAAVRADVTRNLQQLAGLVNQYRDQYGTFPSAETWVQSVARRDPRFLDPWGNGYLYRHDGDAFTLRSLGRDGLPGGQDADEDVSRTFTTSTR